MLITSALVSVALSYGARVAVADNLNPGDCCMSSGSFEGKAKVSSPVRACEIDGVTTTSQLTSFCAGGQAYTCNDYQPFVSDSDPNVSFGFGARAESNDESAFECACYDLKFSGTAYDGSSLSEKTMVVQATNTGGDVAATNFDIQIPGGGVGIFNACSNQWGAPSGGWGAQYGGVSHISECNALPDELKPGCQWRFEWWGDNPTIASIERVQCPKILTDRSQCIRDDDIHQKVSSVISAATQKRRRLTVSATHSGTSTSSSSSPSGREPFESGNEHHRGHRGKKHHHGGKGKRSGQDQDSAKLGSDRYIKRDDRMFIFPELSGQMGPEICRRSPVGTAGYFPGLPL
ncbi:hypothetical protein IE53DRAFT_380660 [Violaceomyces palustris]|uniref:Uncharacterized protein n=1 Tax=Violaceomyces palustris TaxID=1673888 RepID=A0ACD0NU42_9BASI|nr:hypothetical protein IE53DRAFT_380660 [Violaceomyces palustris]